MKRLKSKYEILKQKIYIVIYGANTSGGKLFDLVLLLVILLSVAMVMIDSIKSVDEKYHNFLYYGEWVVTAFLSISSFILFAILDLMPIIGQHSHLKFVLIACKYKIFVFMYFMIVMSIVFCTLMYIIEGGHNESKDIPYSIYWCIVTMTT